MTRLFSVVAELSSEILLSILQPDITALSSMAELCSGLHVLSVLACWRRSSFEKRALCISIHNCLHDESGMVRLPESGETSCQEYVL